MVRSERRCVRAFTLIEVILAVALLAAVMVMLYATWDAGLQAWRAGAESADDLQRTRAIAEGVGDLIRSAVFFDQSDEDEDNDDLYLFEGIHGTFGDNDADSVTFVTFSSRFLRPYEADRLPLRKVRISLEQDENKQPYLALFSSNALTPSDEEPAPLKLSDHVVGFRVHYYDPDVEDWQEDWIDELAMPGQVEVTITYQPTDPAQQPVVQQFVANVAARDALEQQQARTVEKKRQRQPRTTPRR